MRLPSRGSGGGSQQLAELEKRVQEFVENQGKAPCSAQVCKRADEIARDLGMSSFRSSVQWYTKFTKKIKPPKYDSLIDENFFVQIKNCLIKLPRISLTYLIFVHRRKN